MFILAASALVTFFPTLFSTFFWIFLNLDWKVKLTATRAATAALYGRRLGGLRTAPGDRDGGERGQTGTADGDGREGKHREGRRRVLVS